ncbi:hypothetical protein HMI54_004806 [Coelomomyces lativittatus]|nr:hypothetical protein HMI54_004806 [Coelomomyces lativittatus]KAJ1509646.1 hypothetical protein HMI56_006686 [Coelomomyces lativittatus]KAJ1517878.1 hypothetical protein HMI55_005299 [Coelomomyces lativittatus]
MALNTTHFLFDQCTPCLLPQEKIMAHYQDVQMTYESGNGYPGSGANFDVPNGYLYFTTHRLIFVSVPYQLGFRSLELKLHLLQPNSPSPSIELIQSWIGRAAYLQIHVQPLPNGGLPMPGTACFYFKSTAASLVHAILVKLVQQSSSNIHDEDILNIQGEEPLPLYSG